MSDKKKQLRLEMIISVSHECLSVKRQKVDIDCLNKCLFSP